jgi:hypothetical protein
VDIDALSIVKKVWRHAGITGGVWFPQIADIGTKKPRFREGQATSSTKPAIPEMRPSVDWYWTPGVSTSSTSRLAKHYPAQKVVWVDCDDNYNDDLLTTMRPSYVWETSPGHKQAVWLLAETIEPSEFHRDGFVGMLTQALGADVSGVDIGQLLRVPGTVHNKREPFQGTVQHAPGTIYTRGALLSRVARGLGFSPGLASDLGAEDPYGDRSKVLWRFSRNASELGIPEDLTFKLIKATQWNKWADDPDHLKADIAKAYATKSKNDAPVADVQQHQAADELPTPDDDVEAWGMATVEEFGTVLRKPMSWVLPGIIPEGGCGLLVAAPKVGKTRIAIEMALGLASGRKPLGISLPHPRAVGFFSLEDGEYLFSSRLNDSLNVDKGRTKYHWEGHISEDLTWQPPQHLDLFTNFNQVDLSQPKDQQRLYETILKYDLRLVIIDTLSMAIGKSDVSNSGDMYSILKPIKQIAQGTGCAIMFIHHTRKRVFEKGETVQETILGSTALHGWSDFIMNLVAPSEENDMLRLAVQTKMGNDVHHIDSRLKIIKRPPVEPADAVA